MEITFISNSIIINNFIIEHYLELENNYIETYWKISNNEGDLLKDKLHTLAHAKFYLENYIVNKKSANK